MCKCWCAATATAAAAAVAVYWWFTHIDSILGTWVEHPKQNLNQMESIEFVDVFLSSKLNQYEKEEIQFDGAASFSLAPSPSSRAAHASLYYSLNSWEFLLFCFVWFDLGFGFGFGSVPQVLSYERINKHNTLFILYIWWLASGCSCCCCWSSVFNIVQSSKFFFHYWRSKPTLTHSVVRFAQFMYI